MHATRSGAPNATGRANAPFNSHGCQVVRMARETPAAHLGSTPVDPRWPPWQIRISGWTRCLPTICESTATVLTWKPRYLLIHHTDRKLCDPALRRVSPFQVNLKSAGPRSSHQSAGLCIRLETIPELQLQDYARTTPNKQSHRRHFGRKRRTASSLSRRRTLGGLQGRLPTSVPTVRVP